TALAEAKNIPLMARAFALAVEAGRAGYLAGLTKESEARASSPLTGFLRD
ncbi:thiazole synthase, partial [Campylobacter upsaliensis]|nr:thiazole synthase [Campylobacter upsaliensis]